MAQDTKGPIPPCPKGHSGRPLRPSCLVPRWGVLISKPVAEGIRAGRITQAFRRWDAPRVKVGGLQLTAAGLVRFDAVSRVRDPDRLTERDARRAGVKDLATLQKFLDAEGAQAVSPRRPRRGHGLSHQAQLGRRGPADRLAREPPRRREH